MVLAFTEEQAIRIREYGMSVIRFKYCIKNGINLAIYVLNKCVSYINLLFDVCEKLLAIRIREYGMSVIRFKYCIKNGINLAIYVLNKCVSYINLLFDVCEKLLNCTRDIAAKLSDIFKALKEKIELPTSHRFRFVKVLGNIGYRKYDVWVVTRTYLARSNC